MAPPESVLDSIVYSDGNLKDNENIETKMCKFGCIYMYVHSDLYSNTQSMDCTKILMTGIIIAQQTNDDRYEQRASSKSRDRLLHKARIDGRVYSRLDPRVEKGKSREEKGR